MRLDGTQQSLIEFIRIQQGLTGSMVFNRVWAGLRGFKGAQRNREFDSFKTVWQNLTEYTTFKKIYVLVYAGFTKGL